MIKPTPMKRFYLSVPLDREEKTLEKIGELGVTQLVREILIEQPNKSEKKEVFRKFMRLYERMNTILARYPSEKYSSRIDEKKADFDFDQFRIFVEQVETKIDVTITNIEKAEIEIKALRLLEERLRFLKAYNLKVDEIGKFKHIFVKVGFLNNTLLLKLGGYLSGTSIIFTSKPGRQRESFVVVTGLNEDQSLTESVLKMLNFEEFSFPQDLNPEPQWALEEAKNSVEIKEREIRKLGEALLRVREEFDFFEPYIHDVIHLEEAKGSVVRTKSRSLIYGWIPSDKIDSFQTQIQKEKCSLKFEDPTPTDNVPVQLKNKGLLGIMEPFTYRQGVPNYFEIDPTPIYTILYVLMFGMMFGDIGDGVVFIVVGFLLIRLKRSLLTFSPNGLRKLGKILIACGLSAILFGFFYGELFVMEIMHPILLSPLKDITKIMVIALTFGVAQITLALILNITNKIRRKQTIKAVFSGHGIVGLTYYLAGVAAAIAFISELNLSVFLRQDIMPFTFIAVLSLALILLSPVIETVIERKKARLSEKLIEGFGGGLETFITSLANSVSYIRLAAFAIAHGALGLAAVILSSITGPIASYVLINIIVFFVDGFAVLIQSLRLMYYEFSTKFYIGDGTQYKPFKTSNRKTNI